jgi:hypothetical protein
VNEFVALDAVRFVMVKNSRERPRAFQPADHRLVACLREARYAVRDRPCGASVIGGFSAFCSGNLSSRITLSSDLCTRIRPL